jgi:hypothetical protein
MAELNEKEFSMLKTRLVNLGSGAVEHHADTEHPLPPNIVQTRYTDADVAITESWTEAQAAQKTANEKFDSYHALYKTTDTLANQDSKLVKGVYGNYSETLRDFGIKPEKKRTGKKPKPVPPVA